ncbi:MAG: DNA repair and recombination protein RadB [Nanoarchaeota archaeon]
MARVSAGSYDLNKWLFGGYENDIVSIIYGGAGSGKTNFCMLTAVSQAKKGNKVIFIDSEGGFSSERIKQLAPDNYEETLRNILLLKPTSFHEQKEVFKKLSSYLKDEVSMLIVDGMTILYRLDLAVARQKGDGEIKKINAELAWQMKTLAEITRKKGIPIIVTSQVYKSEDEIKIVGGDIMYYWGKCLIELVHENGKRTAYLRKHRSLPEKSLDFQIINEGIKKKWWI